MIFDQITRCGRYAMPWISDVRQFLQRQDLSALKEPEIEICGRDLFVRVMRYQPKPAHENRFETHRIYADIQVVLEGRELMQVAPTDQLKPITEYDEANDYQFYTVDAHISNLIVPSGSFVIFYPGEAHRPSCWVEPQDSTVFKLVFKVRM